MVRVLERNEKLNHYMLGVVASKTLKHESIKYSPGGDRTRS